MRGIPDAQLLRVTSRQFSAALAPTEPQRPAWPIRCVAQRRGNGYIYRCG